MADVLHGYHGCYLRVDLTSGRGEVLPISAEVLRRFIGGGGLGTWLLLQESSAGQEPLSPEAPLVFVLSPLVGSPLTTSAKFAVVSQSPLTGMINDSLASSAFAIAGKQTGYDAIVIVGRAASPSCLVIDDGEVRIVDAETVWGAKIPQATEQLRGRFGKRFRFAVIGPAGERLIRYATISHDGRHAGRGGSGAVMGSKRLKAVGVAGTKTVSFAQPKKLTALAKRVAKLSLGEATAKYRELGTVSNLLTFHRLGTLPTRNFQQATFDGAEAIAPETFEVDRSRVRSSCVACTIGCTHQFSRKSTTESTTDVSQKSTTELDTKTADGQTADSQTDHVRMEYESLFALGSLCGIADVDTILTAAGFCDDFGIDTISAGASIAFAMECAEKGLIDCPSLRFGNGDAFLQLLQQIGAREGIGDLFAEGTRRAAAAIGGGSEKFAPHVKGLEIPGYEPRALQTMALGFAVGTRGADHNRSGAYQVDFSVRDNPVRDNPVQDNPVREESVRNEQGGMGDAENIAAAIATEDEAAIMDSLILCKFLRGVFEDRLSAMAEMLSLVTGWDVTTAELQRTAARIVTAKKWYNMQQGWKPADDRLPERFFEQRLPDGGSQGAVLDAELFRQRIQHYNEQRGWSGDGWVSADRLVELEIVAGHKEDKER